MRKVRHRYILAKIDARRIPEEREFERALWGSITRLFGEYGASQIDLSVIEYNQEGGYAIIRCSHKALPMMRAAMAAITKVGDEETVVHTLLISGTLKALKRKFNEANSIMGGGRRIPAHKINCGAGHERRENS
ncbi:MAG: Rpp14/Pop5 family protein [Candidatus Bathyarchaeia archaeon]|nr:Rpp14/Pop5 family protein [Candidatus Bathyarchaeota archaeon]